MEKGDISSMLIERAMTLYEAREKEFGEQMMRELERVVLLRTVDSKWIEHIDAMDELKRGMGLRSYAQKDPVIEYRNEGFDMFDNMIASIREDTVRILLTIRVRKQEPVKREQVAKPTTASHGEQDKGVKRQPVRKTKVGDNDPCPCGSGKKYKKCCKLKENASTNS